MATLNNAALACVQHGDAAGDVTLIVTYDATFGPLERHLAAHGLAFEERIAVIGEDFGSGADVILHEFPVESVPVPPAAEPLIVGRRRTLTVDRRSLREDPGLLGHDELSCHIDLAAIGLPSPLVSATTPEQVLVRA